MDNKHTLLLILCFWGASIHKIEGANDLYLAGGRSFALSNASLTLVDAYAPHNNQAALAFLDETTFSASYHNLFFLSSIGIKHAALSLNTSFGNVGISYQQIDFAGYYDAKTGFAYARKFSDKFSAAIQFDLLMVRPDVTEKMYYNFTGEISVLAHPSQNLWLAFHMYNPFAVKYQALYYDEDVPVVTRLGFRYAFTPDLFITAEGEGHSVYGFNFKSGFEYQPIEVLSIQAGVGSNPVQISFGAGVKLTKFHINMGLVQTEKAGRSAGFSIDYAF